MNRKPTKSKNPYKTNILHIGIGYLSRNKDPNKRKNTRHRLTKLKAKGVPSHTLFG